MVNDISKDFYTINPKLSIQFGLHATSIRSHYTDLAGLDPRIAITWASGLSSDCANRPTAPPKVALNISV